MHLLDYCSVKKTIMGIDDIIRALGNSASEDVMKSFEALLIEKADELVSKLSHINNK